MSPFYSTTGPRAVWVDLEVSGLIWGGALPGSGAYGLVTRVLEPIVLRAIARIICRPSKSVRIDLLVIVIFKTEHGEALTGEALTVRVHINTAVRRSFYRPKTRRATK